MSDHLKVLGVTLNSSHSSDSDSLGLQLSSPGLVAASELFAWRCCTEHHWCDHWIEPGLLQLSVLQHVKRIFKCYRGCRMLLQELFAKLHGVNITQSTN